MSEQQHWDAVVIGAGIGGLVTASQLAAKGAKVLVLERYLIPGGSGGAFRRKGYTFDVGASMIFGFGEKGYTNLLTRALADVGERCDTVPDPSQLEYHMPGGLQIAVDRDYEQFIADLSSRFPHEAEGIRKFYDACWQVFNCLDAMPLLSLGTRLISPRSSSRLRWPVSAWPAGCPSTSGRWHASTSRTNSC